MSELLIVLLSGMKILLIFLVPLCLELNIEPWIIDLGQVTLDVIIQYLEIYCRWKCK
jgi:hypothetical protein